MTNNASDPQLSPINRLRMVLAGIGVLAGFSLWLLVNLGQDFDFDGPVFVFSLSFAATFFASVLAASGVLGVKRAVLMAFGVAAFAAAFLCWASLRYDDASDVMDLGFPVIAFGILATIPVPFLMSHLGSSTGHGWKNYPALFSHSWNIVVKYSAAWIFTGLSWLLILLSDLLLGLVGISPLDLVQRIDPLAAMLTGGFLGLGLAVADEYSNIVSPYLFLRLLRLFLPVVLAVVSLFVVGMVFSGTGNSFLNFDAPQILLMMVLVSVTLVSAAVDQTDELGVTGQWMRRFARALSILLCVLAGLAIYFLWSESTRDGWMPTAVGWALFASIALIYAVAYAFAALDDGRWADRVRQSNIYLALGLVAFMALTLTPLLNPHRIAVNSQVGRFEAGKVAADDIPVWDMMRQWGRAGDRGIESLSALTTHPEADRLQELITLAEESLHSRDFRSTRNAPDMDALRAELREALTVQPDIQIVPNGMFEQASAGNLKTWASACTARIEGDRPGCVLILADLVPELSGDEGLLLYSGGTNTVYSQFFVKEQNGSYKMVKLLDLPMFYTSYFKPEDLIAALDGDFSVKPANLNALHLNGRRLLPAP